MSLIFRKYYSAHSFILEDVTISNFTIVDSVLTCVSTGGPATTVTWTRDSDILLDNGDNTHKTILGNRDLEQYIHTLNVTETVISGVYGCSVSNSKPSSAKALLNVTGRHQILQYTCTHTCTNTVYSCRFLTNFHLL